MFLYYKLGLQALKNLFKAFSHSKKVRRVLQSSKYAYINYKNRFCEAGGRVKARTRGKTEVMGAKVSLGIGV